MASPSPVYDCISSAGGARYIYVEVISLLIGAVALVLGIVAFDPLLGWAYWLIIPIALVGLVVGMMSDRNMGRNLNLVVIVVGLNPASTRR